VRSACIQFVTRVETVIQMAAYAGFPRAINAALAAKDVTNERMSGGH